MSKRFNLKVIGEVTEYGDLAFLETHRLKNGKPFPDSYKAFVREYGYGRALGEWLIYIPMGEYGDSWSVRSQEIRGAYINYVMSGDIWWELEPDGSVELMIRMIPFAMSENGYYLFWDIERGEGNEFEIYMTDFRGMGFRRVGASLYAVIEKMTGSGLVVKPLPQTFECLTANKE